MINGRHVRELVPCWLLGVAIAHYGQLWPHWCARYYDGYTLVLDTCLSLVVVCLFWVPVARYLYGIPGEKVSPPQNTYCPPQPDYQQQQGLLLRQANQGSGYRSLPKGMSDGRR